MTCDATILYGIPHCSTVKKARAWLDAQGIACSFHDFKKLGVHHGQLAEWAQQAGWENLLNRKGTTWRKLPDARKNAIASAESAFELMIEQTSVIKRPILRHGDTVLIGFNETLWQQHLHPEAPVP